MTMGNSACVYRELKPGRNDGEVRRVSGVNDGALPAAVSGGPILAGHAATRPPPGAQQEKVAVGSDVAADHGQKAWDAGRDARSKAGRSD
jgi:hypothetical protein